MVYAVASKDGQALPPDPTMEPEVPTDPYEGWQQWCEPANMPCKSTVDCRSIHHPSGKRLKCVRPWYSESDKIKVCSPGWSTRHERDHQRARLREFVRLQYFDEGPLCSDGGWRCGRARTRGNKLAALLNMVAHRETTMRPWKRHRLNGDLRANRWAFRRTVKIYADNPHRRQPWRWDYGVGLYGMNASLFTRTWDVAAPPEVLCREVEATEVYLRSTRKAWRKLKSGIDCDGDPGREWHGVNGSPTWYDLHRYASGGKLCPGKIRTKFERRARKVGLEPYESVDLDELGQPIAPWEQNQIASLRTAQIDLFSAAWLLRRAQG